MSFRKKPSLAAYWAALTFLVLSAFSAMAIFSSLHNLVLPIH